MAQEWYYMSGGQKCGPIPGPDLKAMAASGQLQATDKVWRDGMAQWVAAGSVKGLWPEGGVTAAPAVSAAPPLPARKVRPAEPEDDDDDDDAPRRIKRSSKGFTFDGGAGDYFVTGLLSYLLIAFTLGIGTPWAVCMVMTWYTEHTVIDGRRLRFVGTGGELFGQFIIWFLLYIVTLGLYIFWLVPAMTRWVVEHTEFERD